MSIERLEKRWRMDPGDPAVAIDFATALVRSGRPLAGRDVLARTWKEVEQRHQISDVAAHLGVDIWSGISGGPPWRSWMGRAPGEAPEECWRFRSQYSDDRFGLPAAVLTDTLCLVAQSVVVGVRFVRLLAVDLQSGEQRWEEERRNVFGPGGAFAIGGRHDAVKIGWLYSQARDEGFELCLDVLDPQTGQLESQDKVVLEDAIMASPGAPHVLGNRIAWPVSAVTEEQRREDTFFVDADAGRFITRQWPAAPGRGWERFARTGERIFAADSTGIFELVDQKPHQLADFARAPGHVDTTYKPDRTILAAGGFLYGYRPAFTELSPGRFLGQNQAVAIQLNKSRNNGDRDNKGEDNESGNDGYGEKNGHGDKGQADNGQGDNGHGDNADNNNETVFPIGDRPNYTTFACAGADGTVFACDRRRKRRQLFLLRCNGPRTERLAEIDAEYLLGGVWMGGVVVLRVRGDDGLRMIAHDGTSGERLWSRDVDNVWHQGPIPTRQGLGGVDQRGFIALR